MSDPMQEDGRLPVPGTPLPWQTHGSHLYGPEPSRYLIGQITGGRMTDDMAYIVWACNNAPDLQADIDRQADLIGKLYEKLDAAEEALLEARGYVENVWLAHGDEFTRRNLAKIDATLNRIRGEDA